MKNMINNIRLRLLTIYLVSLIVVTSCEDALKEDVYSFVSTSNFYQTASDADAAVLAIYAAQAPDYYAENYFHLTEYPTDQVYIGRNPVNMAVDLWQVTPTHQFVILGWTSMYRTINRANTALERIPAITMDEAQKSILLGEAYFLRASNYFNLVRLFGSIPLNLSEIDSKDESNTPKSSVDAVYQQIIADLQEAESRLPATRTGNGVGRVVKTAAQALLADVYLTREDWSAAASKANEVITSGQHQLLTDFQSIFSVTNKNNKEIIYSIQFDGVTVRSALASFAHAFGTDNPFCANGVQVWSVDTRSDMWKNWSRQDLRRDVSVYDTIVNKRGQRVSVYNTSRPFPAFGKYDAPSEAGVQSSPVNPVVIRYAEVLLIYAEALSQSLNGPNAAAYEAVNQVRRRAYNVPLNEPSAYDLAPGLNAQQFRDAIIQERSLEFVMEGKRLYDLMRTNQFPAILLSLGIPANPNASLYPIPQAEIDANESLINEDQNSGY